MTSLSDLLHCQMSTKRQKCSVSPAALLGLGKRLDYFMHGTCSGFQ